MVNGPDGRLSASALRLDAPGKRGALAFPPATVALLGTGASSATTASARNTVRRSRGPKLRSAMQALPSREAATSLGHRRRSALGGSLAWPFALRTSGGAMDQWSASSCYPWALLSGLRTRQLLLQASYGNKIRRSQRAAWGVISLQTSRDRRCDVTIKSKRSSVCSRATASLLVYELGHSRLLTRLLHKCSSPRNSQQPRTTLSLSLHTQAATLVPVSPLSPPSRRRPKKPGVAPRYNNSVSDEV